MNALNPTSPSVHASEPIKCFKHYTPLYADEAPDWDKAVLELAKARKFERNQHKKNELKFISPAKRKKAARDYLRSRRCLQANMVEANARRPYADRISLPQIVKLSKKYNTLKKLDEPATVHLIPKSGGGARQICDFGPVARGAHRMVLKLLSMAYTPAAFQFNRKSVEKAISKALKHIKEEGYHYASEIDIKGHYPSFLEEELNKVIPLPKAAIHEIVMGASAAWITTSVPSGFIYDIFQAPSGIPQGSAASGEVASWSVAQLKMAIKVKGSVVLNYADNFFVLANSEIALKATCEFLRLAIAKLPGGTFNGVEKQVGTAQAGFAMLGCWIGLEGGQVTVEPTETNLNRLYDQIDQHCETLTSLLIKAKMENSPSLRFQGIQAYLRLKNLADGWINAFSFCDIDPCITDHLQSHIDDPIMIFEITDPELKKAKDASVSVNFNPYGV